MTVDLQDRLINHEGLRTLPYKDQFGNLTIGVGRNLSSNGISHDEAIYMLQNDIHRVQQEVAHAMPWVLGMDDQRASVLYELCFWIGINGLLEFKNMITAVRDQRYADAAMALRNSLLHQQIPGRTDELADILESGEGG